MPHDVYPELARRLHAAGWRRVGAARGSHETWRHPEIAQSVIVPRCRSRHTANAVLKQAGPPKAF